jgi:ABC-2 type transport system permease protein
VGAALTAAVVGVLDVPMVGPWWQLAVALGLTLLASIGLGLVNSLISATDTQAVQYTMIVLLGSLFFTGFFLTIDQLARPAQILTWAIPASYGMALLRDTMLRGVSLDPLITGGVAAYAFVAFLIVLVGARRRLSTIR